MTPEEMFKKWVGWTDESDNDERQQFLSDLKDLIKGLVPEEKFTYCKKHLEPCEGCAYQHGREDCRSEILKRLEEMK